MSNPDIKDLLLLMHEKKASDLHLTSGAPPVLRIDGTLVPTHYDNLTPDTTKKLIYSLLTEEQIRKFESANELDISFGVKGIGRIRMNVYKQRGAVAAALRLIPNKIPTFEELGLPSVVYKFMELQKGLILVTGPTGMGKSTTLASMVEYLNQHRHSHIITIEDPIEYTFTHGKSIVNQREIGQDTSSFTEALKRVLREDPDIILIGEMRDLETVQAALTIAETGHLVLSTLHTNDAPSTITRIIDIFPPHLQQQVRTQLSLILEGVIAQVLIPKSHGGGRVLACEVLVATPAVKNLIRENKIEQIYLAIQTGGKYGMQTLNQSLADLYFRGLITYADALMNSREPEELRKLLQRVAVGT